MKKEAKHLFKKAIESLILSIEIFNRPNENARVHSVLILMDHSFEMLLKAAIVEKGGKIKQKNKGETIGFETCLRKALSDNNIKFLSEDEVLTLQSLNGLRDAAQHYLLELSEQHLYFQAQSGLTLFRDISKRVFDVDLRSYLPIRVLPLSTTPPTNINSFFIDEIEEIKKIIQPKNRKTIEALEKLRALSIIEKAIQGEDSQPKDSELRKILNQLKQGGNFKQIFPGVATLNFTSEGYGPSLDLRITRKEGIPIQIVPEGTHGAAIVAIKRVNELDFYNLGRDQLAKKVGLTGPKTTALIYFLQLKNDPECFKKITIGKTKFDRYSQKTIKVIKDELRKTDINTIWEKYKNRNRNS